MQPEQEKEADYDDFKPLPSIDSKFVNGDDTKIIKPTKSTYFM